MWVKPNKPELQPVRVKCASGEWIDAKLVDIQDGQFVTYKNGQVAFWNECRVYEGPGKYASLIGKVVEVSQDGEAWTLGVLTRIVANPNEPEFFINDSIRVGWNYVREIPTLTDADAQKRIRVRGYTDTCVLVGTLMAVFKGEYWMAVNDNMHVVPRCEAI